MKTLSQSVVWSGILLAILPAIFACSPITRPTPATVDRLLVGGSGSAYPPLAALARAFSNRYPQVQFTFEASSQTSVAVNEVAAGTEDIGAIARPLSETERLAGLKQVPIARDAVVIAIHRSAKVDSLTTEQLQAIYRGDLHVWAELGGTNGEIIVLDHAEGESAKMALREYVLGMNLPITSDAVLISNEQDMYDAIANIPDTIGYFSMSYLVANRRVHAISVDGIQPTPETLASGAYRVVRPISIVVQPERAERSPLREFLQFLSSVEADLILRQSGLVPETKP